MGVGYRAGHVWLRSVITAMVTPFDDDGRVDLDGAAALARWLVEHGNDGLVVTGTTGEAACLTDDEQVELWRAVRAAVDVPVIAGTGTNDTRHAVELTARGRRRRGGRPSSSSRPYYNRPSQAGIEAHFRAVAAATDLPVHALRHPRPHRPQDRHATLLLRLAHEVPNIVGLKDAAGDPGETARVVAEAPDDFERLLRRRPAHPAAARRRRRRRHRRGHPLGRPGDGRDDRRFREGRRRPGPRAQRPPARELRLRDRRRQPRTRCPTKAMLRALGLPAGPCRPPMGPTARPRGASARCADGCTRERCERRRRRPSPASRARWPDGRRPVTRHVPRRSRRDRPQLRLHRGRRARSCCSTAG